MQENTPDNPPIAPLTNNTRNIRQSPRVKKPKIIKDGTLSITSSSMVQTKTNGHTEKASTTNSHKHNNHDNSGGAPRVSPIRLQTTSPKTLQEKLAATPGFSMKPRRRGNKRKSFNAQLAETKEGAIDLTPDSFLVNINLKSIIDSNTFTRLPPQYQQNLIANLPECDKLQNHDNTLRMSSTALNNEFFAKACQEWRERLSDAEFTPENQQRLKQEQEKELLKLDPWKAKHFEPVWGQRNMADVPKATGPSPQPNITTPVPQAKPKPIRSSMLVSQMLRKRDVSRNVAAKLQSTTPSAYVNNNSSSSSITLSMPVTSGLLTTAASTIVTPTDKQMKPEPKIKTEIKTEVKIESISQSTSPSPAKKIRVPAHPGQQVQAQAKTLAQIRAQTEEARKQKSGNNVPSVIQSQLAAGPQQSSAKVLNTGTVAASFRLAGQTRTLAQIKAQNQAAKTVVNVISIPQTSTNPQTVTMRSLLTDPSSPVNKPGGQTRTLAQIKARTRQAQMKAAHSVKIIPSVGARMSPDKSKSPETPSTTPRPATPTSRAMTPTKIQTVTVSPAKPRPLSKNMTLAEQQKLNLQRSREICQAEFEKSRYKQESPTSTAKLPTANTGNNVTIPTVSPCDTSISVKTVPKASTPTKDTTKILLVTSNNLSQPSTVYLMSAPQSTVVANQGVPVSGNSAGTTRVITIPASQNNVIVSNSQGIGQMLSPETVRALLANNPPRASSAPPNHVHQPSDVITIVRSASVDPNNTNSNSTPEVNLNLSSEQLNFLSKAGTVIPVGRKGSQVMKIIRRPTVTVVETSSPQSVVQGTLSVKSIPTSVESSVLANGNKVLTETQVANRIGRSVLSNSTLIQNVQVITSGQNMTPVLMQGGTTLPISVSTNSLADGNLLSQSSCACSLKAMVMCQKCGAFCHDDCIGPSKLCVTCLITT